MSIDYTEVKAGTILKVPCGRPDDGYMYLVVSKFVRRPNKVFIYASHTVRYCNNILDIMTFGDPYEYTEERFKSKVTVLKGRKLTKLKQDLEKGERNDQQNNA